MWYTNMFLLGCHIRDFLFKVDNKVASPLIRMYSNRITELFEEHHPAFKERESWSPDDTALDHHFENDDDVEEDEELTNEEKSILDAYESTKWKYDALIHNREKNND